MRRQIDQQTGSKSGIKRATPTGRSKSINRMTAQKRSLTSGRNNFTLPASKNFGGQSKPDILFSYKSADDKNVLAIIDTVRTGISFNEFQKIADKVPFSLAEWANYLQLSERTIQRNQKKNKPFQQIQSERIIELVMLYEYGVEVFGDKENFGVWLNSKSIVLGGRTPKELLDTKFGVGMVKDELGRIAYGVLA